MITLKQIQVLAFVVGILQSNHIPFQLTGGMAAIAYGATRKNRDIDIDVGGSDIPAVRKLFADYITEDFHHLIDPELDMWVLTLIVDGVIVDISRAEESYFFSKADGTKVRIDAQIAHATVLEVAGLKVPVQRKDELIRYKTLIAQSNDIADVKQITSESRN